MTFTNRSPCLSAPPEGLFFDPWIPTAPGVRERSDP